MFCHPRLGSGFRMHPFPALLGAGLIGADVVLAVAGVEVGDALAGFEVVAGTAVGFGVAGDVVGVEADELLAPLRGTQLTVERNKRGESS